MRQNILLAGVGGQGILSEAFVICNAALEEGLNFKQAEVHGMAVRGGAVQSNLRISSDEISSDLIPKGECNIVLAVEPMEALRYIDYLCPDGAVITSINPYVNIPNYPEMSAVWNELKKAGFVIPIDANGIAKESGSALAANMVMLGAGSVRLELKVKSLENWIRTLWNAKGDKVVEVNLKAFHAGRKMAEFMTALTNAGLELDGLIALAGKIPVENADLDTAPEWASLLKNQSQEKMDELIDQKLSQATVS